VTIPAPWTAVHDTPNKSIRQPVGRRGVVLHHAAMTSLDGLRRLAMGAKQVSATAICKDTRIELLVPDDRYRPWSLSSGYWDSALRSVETCNESTDGWTISDASHWSLAKAVAYWAQKDGFYPHRSGAPETWTVLGHGEVYEFHDASYGTACPGGMNLDLVATRAQGLLKASSTAGNVDKLIQEADMAQVQYYERSQKGYSPEWMVAGIDIKGGFEITQDVDVAKFWSRQYRPGQTPIKLDRDTYVATQQYWAGAARKHQAWQVSVLKAALG